MLFDVRWLVVLVFISGCHPVVKQANLPADSQKLTFQLAMNSRLIRCQDIQHGLLFDRMYWQVEHLKFYLHRLGFSYSGQKEEVELIPSDWQTQQVALLSLEPTACDDTPILNHSVVHFKGSDWVRQADTMHFTLGVPSDLNHKNPLTQPSPLNLPLMFWSWQLGHKFIRWDMTQNAQSWSFHLGSLGCDSVASVRPPSSPCSEPNRVEVLLPKPQ